MLINILENYYITIKMDDNKPINFLRIVNKNNIGEGFYYIDLYDHYRIYYYLKNFNRYGIRLKITPKFLNILK